METAKKEIPNWKEVKNYKKGDKLRIGKPGGAPHTNHGVCTVEKTRNYKKGLKVYVKSEYGYGFSFWA